MGRSRIVFIVPARNEEKTISGVIDFLIKYGDIIVIDDCSIDNTYNILLKYKITILKNIINQGYQKSVIQGLIEAKKLDYEYAVTFDADGQHLGINMKNFINELNNNYDLIVTQRNIKNRFSENILSAYSNYFFQGIDLFSGMKAYKIKKINKSFFDLKINTFCSELTIKLIKKNFVISTYPIRVLKRKDSPRIGINLLINFRIISILLYFLIKYNILNSK